MWTYPQLSLLWELESHGSTAEFLDYGSVPPGMSQTHPGQSLAPEKLRQGQIVVVEILVAGMWSGAKVTTSWFRWTGATFEEIRVQVHTQPKRD
jgi:hypothetical protein